MIANLATALAIVAGAVVLYRAIAADDDRLRHLSLDRSKR